MGSEDFQQRASDRPCRGLGLRREEREDAVPTPGQASGEQPALRRRVRQASESLDIHQLPISQESSGQSHGPGDTRYADPAFTENTGAKTLLLLDTDVL